MVLSTCHPRRSVWAETLASPQNQGMSLWTHSPSADPPPSPLTLLEPARSILAAAQSNMPQSSSNGASRVGRCRCKQHGRSQQLAVYSDQEHRIRRSENEPIGSFARLSAAHSSLMP